MIVDKISLNNLTFFFYFIALHPAFTFSGDQFLRRLHIITEPITIFTFLFATVLILPPH